MSGPLSVPVVCTACKNTDLPWWQVGILTVVGCLIAYGLLWGASRLLPGARARRHAARRGRDTESLPREQPGEDRTSAS